MNLATGIALLVLCGATLLNSVAIIRMSRTRRVSTDGESFIRVHQPHAGVWSRRNPLSPWPPPDGERFIHLQRGLFIGEYGTMMARPR